MSYGRLKATGHVGLAQAAGTPLAPASLARAVWGEPLGPFANTGLAADNNFQIRALLIISNLILPISASFRRGSAHLIVIHLHGFKAAWLLAFPPKKPKP